MVKVIFRVWLLLVLLACASPIFATQVTVLPSQVPMAQISGLPGEVTGTATASNGSASVTLTTNFRTAWIGVSGYLINLSGTDYYVSATASGGVLTLSTPYSGSSGSVSYRVYPWILLKIYADRSYTPLGASYVVQPGVPGSSNWYVNKAASVKAGQVYLPQMTLDATTDAVNPAEQAARLSAFFYRQDNSLISPYACFTSFQVPPEPSTSWTALCSYNQTQTSNPPDTNVYTRGQIDAFLPVCTAGQMAYYQGTGRVLTCLTVGAGLNITGGVITSSGGGGGSGAWSALGPPTQPLTLNHQGYSTAFSWSNNTGGATLFDLATGSQDIGTGYLFQLQTPGTSNTKAPLRVTARGTESLIVSATGLTGVGRSTPVAQLDVLASTITTPAGRFNVPAGAASDILQLQTNGTNIVRFVPVGATVNSVFGNVALLPTATDGFVYIPSTSGTPTATPTSYVGQVPLVFNTATNHLYGFSGSWRDLTGAGGGGSGSSIWSDLLAPNANLVLNHFSGPVNYTTAFNWNSATATSSLFTLANGNNDTGTSTSIDGALLNLVTPGSTNTKNPLQITSRDVNAMRVRYDGAAGFGEGAFTGTATDERFVVDMSYPTMATALRGHGGSFLNGPTLRLERSRGTAALPTSVQSNDILGIIDFAGKAGALTNVVGARIFGWATDTVLSGAIPTSLYFQTSDGTGVLTNRLFITHEGTSSILGGLTVSTDSTTRRGVVITTNGAATADALTINTSGVDVVRFIPNAGAIDTVLGGTGLVSSTTTGFTYIASLDNQPSGLPTIHSGVSPLILENDTTNGEYRLWSYMNGQWRNLSGSGGGGGSSVWSALTSPTFNLDLGMSTYRTKFEWGVGTGAGSNLFTLTTSTGTPEIDFGYLLSVETPGASAQKAPFRARARGQDSLVVEADGDIGIGILPTRGLVEIAKSTTFGQTIFYRAVGMANTSVVGSSDPMEHLVVTDTSTATYGTLVGSQVDMNRAAGSTSHASTMIGSYWTAAFDQSFSGNYYTTSIKGPVVSSGKTLAKHVALLIDPPIGAGTVTTDYGIILSSGVGSSGFGIATPLGQLHVVSKTSSTIGLIVDSQSTPTQDILQIRNATTTKVKFAPGGTTTSAVNSVFATAALATTATDGFVYLPSTTSTPTGTPTSYTGAVPVVVRNEAGFYKLYGYMGANWQDLSVGSGGGSTVWSNLTSPAGNLSLSMASTTTAFTWGSATTTAVNPLFTLANGADDTGTGYLLSVETPGTNNVRKAFRVQVRNQPAIDTNVLGDVGIGIAPATKFHIADPLSTITIVTLQATGSGSETQMNFRQAEGSIAIPQPSLANATVGSVNFRPFSSASSYVTVASIYGRIDGSNATNPGGLLNFYTRATGSGALSSRMTIDSNGRVGIPSTLSSTTQLSVIGTATTDVVLALGTPASPTGDVLQIKNNITSIVRFVPGGTTMNSVFGNAALATTATNGFVYLPSTAGTPTGVPTSFTGTVPLVYNTATNHLYGYNAGWQDLTGAGGGSTAWHLLTPPSTLLNLTMGANQTTMTWNSATGSGSNLWVFTNGSGDSGTGYLVSIETPGGGNLKSPFRVRARGVDALWMDATGQTWIRGPINTGSLPVQLTDAAGFVLSTALSTVAVANGGTGITTTNTVRAYNSASISIPNNAETGLNFDSERYDTNTIHSTVSNTSRLTATVAGTYTITMNLVWAQNTTGIRYGYVRLNGTTLIAYGKVGSPGAGSADDPMAFSTIYQLNAGDYVEVVVFQNSGGALNVNAGANHTPEFSMVRVSN